MPSSRALVQAWGSASGSCSARSAAGKPHDVVEARGGLLLATSSLLKHSHPLRVWVGQVLEMLHGKHGKESAQSSGSLGEFSCCKDTPTIGFHVIMFLFPT